MSSELQNEKKSLTVGTVFPALVPGLWEEKAVAEARGTAGAHTPWSPEQGFEAGRAQKPGAAATVSWSRLD